MPRTRKRESTTRLTEAELLRLARVCADIAEKVAAERGFVAIRDLLSEFGARLVSRPLLVEAMLGTVPGPDGRGETWVVLVDSEKFRLPDNALAEEASGRTLPKRLRNTIAHELVHSLAFRPSEFGLELKRKLGTRENPEVAVEIIEKETELLSPLLLLTDRALGRLFQGGGGTLSDVTNLLDELGVSRFVFISRICFLKRLDPRQYLGAPAMRDCAFGIAELNSSGSAVLRSWPLFTNFERSIEPCFLSRLRDRDRLPAEEVFGDLGFYLRGGPGLSTTQEVEFGLNGRPNAGRARIECSIEKPRHPQAPFLFLIRRLG